MGFDIDSIRRFCPAKFGPMSFEFSGQPALLHRSVALWKRKLFSFLSLSGKDENGRIKSHPALSVFLYFFHLFPYLSVNMEMGWEDGRGVSRSYLRDPVFIRDDPVFIKFEKDLLSTPYIISCSII